MSPSAVSFKPLSCGVVLLNPDHEVLLCHVTGQSHWDLPKGGMDPGETPLQTALRETREETGLVLDAERLHDLGRLAYTAKKDLHLFSGLLPRFDLGGLHCESQFSERGSGKRRPEMDDYAWVAFDDIAEHCTLKMAEVLTVRIDLGGVVARLALQQRAALAA